MQVSAVNPFLSTYTEPLLLPFLHLIQVLRMYVEPLQYRRIGRSCMQAFGP